MVHPADPDGGTPDRKAGPQSHGTSDSQSDGITSAGLPVREVDTFAWTNRKGIFMDDTDSFVERVAEPLTRRRMLRLIGGVALAAVPGVAIAQEASAGRSWCRWDPVLKIDGQVVDVWLSSYTEMNTAATGPTQINVLIPRGSTGSVLATDNGFGGNGYSISFSTSRSLRKSSTHSQVQISVFQPASTSKLPVKVDFTPRSTGVLTSAASVLGRANKWIVIKTS